MFTNVRAAIRTAVAPVDGKGGQAADKAKAAGARVKTTFDTKRVDVVNDQNRSHMEDFVSFFVGRIVEQNPSFTSAQVDELALQISSDTHVQLVEALQKELENRAKRAQEAADLEAKRVDAIAKVTAKLAENSLIQR
jgi:hypothetical protein